MEIRKAVMADVPHIHRLVNDYAQQGLMLRRPLMLLYENVRDFAVAVEDGVVVGTGALHVLWHDLAEIRSLAVDPARTGGGVGRRLVEFLLAEAEALGLRRVMALTYQVGFFEKCGFAVVPKEKLPQKVWKECVYCDKFHACDEIAMIRYLGAPPAPGEDGDIPLVELPLWIRG
ncbi:N-acetyltransferase [Caldinitratiruptor microaerophilus]|uniref:Acetyltransferase n=1 Tax=Caldinitratiruptor microaerophilus TaxID=671077 RepID=A0AA35CLG5_9FIRM|nr:N-acetyltransferase [Caldinitratiruptor microaerophilus]BDG61312.1 acetyltransferase [Caldinitratiruptor microaerophilus]